MHIEKFNEKFLFLLGYNLVVKHKHGDFEHLTTVLLAITNI